MFLSTAFEYAIVLCIGLYSIVLLILYVLNSLNDDV